MAADIVYGLHAVSAVLRHHPDSIQELLVLQGRQDARMEALLEQAGRHHIATRTVERRELDEVAAGQHQGIVALCRPLKLEKSEGFLDQLLQKLEHPPFLLVLDGVTDPHNLGACLRSAEAAGVDAVIVPRDKSA